ncbi:hypothetical protein, partial [Rhodothalassium salexigens]|uniref:hypothetical protein n=1 Tax=Rhodothalassium salexigens TaxID=1086 RepID=UPI001A92C6AC
DGLLASGRLRLPPSSRPSPVAAGACYQPKYSPSERIGFRGKVKRGHLMTKQSNFKEYIPFCVIASAARHSHGVPRKEIEYTLRHIPDELGIRGTLDPVVASHHIRKHGFYITEAGSVIGIHYNYASRRYKVSLLKEVDPPQTNPDQETKDG